MNPDVVFSAFKSFEWPLQIELAIGEARARLEKEQVQFMQELEREKKEFWENMEKWKQEVEWVKGLSDYSKALECAQRLENLHQDLTSSVDLVQSFADREKLFQVGGGDPSRHLGHTQKRRICSAPDGSRKAEKA